VPNFSQNFGFASSQQKKNPFFALLKQKELALKEKKIHWT
jgi:hypothetical protein